MVALLLTAAGIYGLVVAAGAVGADSVGFVVTVTLIGFGFALFVGGSLERYLPASLWRRFSLSRAASRRWGVDCFNAFLWRIGWNKRIVAMRKCESDGNEKESILRQVRASAVGHSWSVLLHVASAIWAVTADGWLAAVVLLMIGIIGHVYPVLLQIRVMTRLRE